MRAIFKREVNSYFHTMTGYLFCAFLLFFAGIYLMALNLRGGYANFEYVPYNMGFAFLIATPILTMRVIAEERRQKTDQLLYSLPIRLTQVVLGKYAALLAVLALPILFLGIYPLVLSLFGTVNLAVAYGSLFGFFLMGAALVAMGLFLSSLSESQVSAAVLTFVAVLLNYYLATLSSYVPDSASASLVICVLLLLLLALCVLRLTQNVIAVVITLAVGVGGLALAWHFASGSFENLFPALLNHLSLYESFYSFVDGVFDWTSVVYFLSVIGVFLLLTVQTLEKRRWSE